MIFLRNISVLSLAMGGALSTAGFAQDAQNGEDLYFQYCVGCHGMEARGDGNVAAVLKVKPADLTGLSARNDGVYPTVLVAYRIDGRDPIIAHGGTMPVYGEFLGEPLVAMKAPSGQPLLIGQEIADLIAYLETIQE